ncbi:hypothetical protein K9O30_21985 [Clostridium bowmanii]|uniref:hypothetical protein n=1 Tax=Clostridium bowmanii TaxID=132925 RepID=UPI001C0CD8E2|nr:hypothetical protein [Clostridium bowmanii]MBU3192090.1 hypothetical protein [Clostridium bowmanii]MCA1076341.1 hypothetical protein [Clostridium bowmanii]
MKYILDECRKKTNYDFILTIDCEGYNFDKNLKNNLLNLERLLKLNSENNVYTLLFITPFFAEMMNELNIIEKIKQNYKIIFGLHIHPNNLPESINKFCPFIEKDEDLIAKYSYDEQKIIIKLCYEYVSELGIGPIEAFRGGYFSIDDNTEKILSELTPIKYESHNIYRPQYKVTKNVLTSLPVYAQNENVELRLEYFNIEKLSEILTKGILENKKLFGITHSYLLDPNDFHYKRDKIELSIYERMSILIDIINKYR